MIPGFTARIAPSSVPVLRIHYSSDPASRPGTPAGDEWLKNAVMGIAGGIRSPRWRKEREIEYHAFGGAKLFPDWDLWCQGPIVCAPFTPKGYRLYASYDHGWNNPSAYHVHGVNRDGEKVTLWEFYASHVPLNKIAAIIKGQSVTLPDGRRFEGNPFAGEEVWKVADPSIWADDQPMKDEPNKSIADLFAREKVFFLEGERGGDITVAEWLLSYDWADPSVPRYRITKNCPKLIWELGQQRHKELSEKQALTKDAFEQLIDKDNHAWDGLKMFLKRFPPGPSQPKPVQKPDTFMWWREQAIRATRGEAPRSFKREMVSG